MGRKYYLNKIMYVNNADISSRFLKTEDICNVVRTTGNRFSTFGFHTSILIAHLESHES